MKQQIQGFLQRSRSARPLRELGILLDRLVRTRPGKAKAIPEDIETEAVVEAIEAEAEAEAEDAGKA